MSNPGLIIEERSRDIGDFLVGRLIPFRKKRMVGPFIFIDHMGPSKIGTGTYLDIDPHPHIGLCTLTYLFEGEILHRDSIGSEQLIKPGDVNLMTAGSGVTHTERTPSQQRDGTTRTLHGYQIWIALPKEEEDRQPEFFHLSTGSLPSWENDGFKHTLVSGKALGYESPVPAYSPHYMIDCIAQKDSLLQLDQLYGETGLVITNGNIAACGQSIPAGNMLIAKHEEGCQVEVSAGTHLLVFGGDAFPEERHIYWNFVATSKEKIEAAKVRWRNRDFPKVVNDKGYIPLPGET